MTVMSVPFERRKLGKKAAPSTPHPVALGKHVSAQHQPAASVDWHSAGRTFPLYRNDEIFDCTCAGAAHMIEVWTAHGNAAPVILPVSDVITAYSAVSGYDPDTGHHDDGAYLRTVLRHWETHGIGGHKIEGFASIDPLKDREVRHAIEAFGGVYLGLQLPITAGSQKTWSVPKEGLVREGRPGSWGGHAVNALGYDEDYLYFVTFGERTKMTWEFLHSYCDEAYAVVSMDFVRSRPGGAPHGVALDALLAELKKV